MNAAAFKRAVAEPGEPSESSRRADFRFHTVPRVTHFHEQKGFQEYCFAAKIIVQSADSMHGRPVPGINPVRVDDDLSCGSPSV